MVKISLHSAKNCSNENKESFIKKFLIRNRTNKMTRFVFFNLVDDKIGYLNSLTKNQIMKHHCLISKAMNLNQVEVIEFFLKKNIKTIELYLFDISSIEMFELLKNNHIKNYHYDQIITNSLENNYTDLSTYFIKNYREKFKGLKFNQYIYYNNHKFNEDTFQILFENNIFDDYFYKIEIRNENLIHKFMYYDLGRVIHLKSFIDNVDLLSKYQYDFRFVEPRKCGCDIFLLCLAAFDNFYCDIEELILSLKNFIGKTIEIRLAYKMPFLEKIMPRIIKKYSESEREILLKFLCSNIFIS